MLLSIVWTVITIIAAAVVYYLDGVTYSSLTVICSFFVYSMRNIWLMSRICNVVNQVNESDALLDIIKKTKLATLWEAYEQTQIYVIDGQKKTNIPSSEIFSVHKVTRNVHLNLRIVDAAAGTLVGFGLLGTFLGLTLGVRDFDTTNVQNIQSGIQSLLDGMSTAFMTSLFGMGLSIIYTLVEKRNRHQLISSLIDLSDRLDKDYYIDDQQLLLHLMEPKLTYRSESGEKIPISFAIRDILKESEQQSKALKSFSTDLAMELNQGFEAVLSNQIQAKIIPLMENVDTTTRSIVEHIDQMAEAVTAPATDLIGSVIDELKKSMSSLVNELRSNISSSASHELEQLVASLSEATTSIGMLPKNMENVTTVLQITIEEVKDAISEITNTSANTNASAMKQMQEQIAFATGSISNAMTEVKEIMTSLTQTSEQSGQEMVAKLTAASEQMGIFLNGVIAEVSKSVQSSMKSITDDISDKQTGLMALQESTMSETEKLLAQFNTGLERLEKMNDYIAGTMNTFQQAQGQITGSTAHLQSITSDMKMATEVFHKTQDAYVLKMSELQQRTQQAIGSIVDLLHESGNLSDEYIEKFEIIKTGIASIFTQIQKGMMEYSQNVQSSTQKYLENYSRELTRATNALSTAIQQQNDVTEVIADELEKFRRK